MNKKLFKMPILFALILCICFVFVGCKKNNTPPEGVSQEVYDDTLKLLQEAGEYLKEGDYANADKVLIEYERTHPVITGRPGERVGDDDKSVVLKAKQLIEDCIYYSDKTHYEGDLVRRRRYDREDIYIEMQKLVNTLKKGYTIDIQEDHKIIIEETKK